MDNKTFINSNFLLQNNVAERLYHDYAAALPIIDYHNHLSPQEIAEDINFTSITDVWLRGDHYKWRAMRANGINEKYITGSATDKEKFEKWAMTVPYTMRNPLYHWTHLELQRYFDISDLLNSETAENIYELTTDKLQKSEYSVKGLLHKMNVEIVCTTDHPTDDLAYHKQERMSDSDLNMLPTFRPDKFLVIDNPEFLEYLQKLEVLTGSKISTFDNLLSGLVERIEYFHALGCQLSDHGLSQLFSVNYRNYNLDNILQKRISNKKVEQEEVAAFQMALLHELAMVYYKKNWTMQLHLGAIRNNNSRLLLEIGADVGADSIGDYEQAEGLAAFLNRLDSESSLTKTIIYNLNPRDNEVFATMIGNYNDGSMPGKIQWGSAWWFLDQKDGMEKQINTLSNMGLISRFIGMLTDSRSFLSFPRHEYFRRILCNLIGTDVINGELPNDVPWLGSMVSDICYNNAKNYFDF